MSGSALKPSADDMRIDHFQMVSRVELLDVEMPMITARARVPDNHSIFKGHFPGHPLMPRRTSE